MKEKVEENKKRCWQPNMINAVSSSKHPGCEAIIERLKNELSRAYKKSDTLKNDATSTQNSEDNSKIKELKEKIEKIKKECQLNKEKAKEEVKPSEFIEEESDIQVYYQAEMDKILEKEKSIDSQISALKELRKKIDKTIESLIKKKESINVDDFSGLVEDFKIKPKEVIADNLKIDAKDKEFTKKINGKEFLFKPAEDKVIIKSGEFEVETKEDVELKDDMKVRDVELKVMPEEIKDKIKDKIKKAEIVKEDKNLMYKIKTEEDRKFLYLFKLKGEKEIYFNAMDGKKIKEKKPWWFALSSG